MSWQNVCHPASSSASFEGHIGGVPACGAPDCLWLVIVKSILVVFVVTVFHPVLVFVDPNPFFLLLRADPEFSEGLFEADVTSS